MTSLMNIWGGSKSNWIDPIFIGFWSKPRNINYICRFRVPTNEPQHVHYRAFVEGWTSLMWTKFTGVLIWKTQNPWIGPRGQFYDHLHDQTAGFYGCRCAAEPIHVQLNLASYFIDVLSAT
jgi:mannosylglycoprotein endo-beta-mannosidase